jgi:hypothetical protein
MRHFTDYIIIIYENRHIYLMMALCSAKNVVNLHENMDEVTVRSELC